MVDIKKTLKIILLSFFFSFAFYDSISAKSFVGDFPSDAKKTNDWPFHYYTNSIGNFSSNSLTGEVSFRAGLSNVGPVYAFEMYKDGSLLYSYEYSDDTISDNWLYPFYLDNGAGIYRFITYRYDGTIVNDILLDFDLNSNNDPISDFNNKIDDTNNNLKKISGSLSSLKNINDSMSNVVDKLSNISEKVGSAISQLDSVNSNLSKLNNDINSNFNNALAKMDISNNHLNDIKNNLNTDKPAASYNKPNTDNILDSNRPVQNETAYQDNKQYFEEKENINITDKLPNPNQEIEKWEGVNDPEQQTAEQELNKEDELSKENEFQKDEELTKDNFQQDEELTREEFQKDEELQKDTFQQEEELTREEFQKDEELTKDSFQQDEELTSDSFQQDKELEKDNFNNTENYNNTNFFNQTEKYEADISNYGLRWKSVNGDFQ